MMRSLLITLLASLAISSAYARQNDSVKIIANTELASVSLSKAQLRNIFMGSAGSQPWLPVTLSPDHASRLIFNTKIIGLTESRIQSYWAQMRFTGRSTPPIEFDNVEDLINYLIVTPGAIGYVISDTPIPDELTVIAYVR